MLRLELVDISKSYPAVKANDRVSLRVAPGEINAVLGENGAGKSTLMKIIYGAVRPDGGEMRWNGERVEVASPAAARALGISMVYQHFSLFDTLTAAENVWLGLDKSLSLAEVTARIRKVAGEYGLDVDPVAGRCTRSRSARSSYSAGRDRARPDDRAQAADPRRADAAVLTPQAVQTLFVTAALRKPSPRRPARSSTDLAQARRDPVAVPSLHGAARRQGHGRGFPGSDEGGPTPALSRLRWIGAEPPQLQHRAARPGAVVLSVRELTLAKEDPFGTALERISFDVRAGEVVGIAGVSGNGQQELMAAVSGEDRRAPAGSIALFDRDIARASPRTRRAAGLHFVPEERLGRGAVPTLSLAQNTLLTRTRAVGAGGWIRVGDVAALAEALIRRFNVKAGGPGSAAKSLSGGNLQKFIVGREIDAGPKLLVVSQPTWASAGRRRGGAQIQRRAARPARRRACTPSSSSARSSTSCSRSATASSSSPRAASRRAWRRPKRRPCASANG